MRAVEPHFHQRTFSTESVSQAAGQQALSLGRNLIRSRKEAVIALGAAATTVCAIFCTSGLWQLCAAWALIELLFCGFQRYRCFPEP